MAVPNSIYRVDYNGDGTTTEFTVPFYFLANADVTVTHVSSAGAETVWTEGSEYTLTGAGDEAGGTLTATSAPASGAKLVLRRAVAATQEIEYPENDPFPSSSHEQGLDKLTMLVQQIQEQADRAIKRPVGDATSIDMTLPSARLRASMLAGYDADGKPTVVSGLDKSSETVSVPGGSVSVTLQELFTREVHAVFYGWSTTASAEENRAAIRACQSALGPNGGKILLPMGSFAVAPADGKMVLPIDRKNVEIEGAGWGRTILKLPNDCPAFTSIIGPETPSTDVSGLRLTKLTLDYNGANNLHDDIEDFRTSVDGFTQRRTAVYAEVGRDVVIEDCEFIDFPRQSIFLNYPNSTTALGENWSVTRNIFRATVDHTPSVSTWDTVAVFLRGDGHNCSYNWFLGHADNYYCTRTVAQISGSNCHCDFNFIDKYYRGPLVGLGGADLPAPCRNVTCIGNVMTRVNQGVSILSHSNTITSGFGVIGMIVAFNQIYGDKNQQTLDGTDNDSPVGIFFLGTNNLPTKGLKILHNYIEFEEYTGQGRSGIDMFLNGLTDPMEDTEISDNLIVRPNRAGIRFASGPSKGTKCLRNRIIDPGQFASATGGDRAGINVANRHTDLKLNGNELIDRRSTTLATACIWLATANPSEKCECLDNTVDLADSRSIPVVENATGNIRPMIRARIAGMNFVQPSSSVAYGSEVIDQSLGVTWAQVNEPGGTSWLRKDDSQSFQVEGTGFDGTAPTGACLAWRSGQAVTLFLPQLSGTSNAATFTVTGIPADLASARSMRLGAVHVADDGTDALGVAEINGDTITLHPSATAGASGWTASGTKTLYACAIRYTLA